METEDQNGAGNYTCTIRQVDYPGASQHASYYLLKVDLEHAFQCVEVILAGDIDENLLAALFSGAVIAYSRCFVSGSGSKLNASEVFKGNSKNPLVFHDVIIGLRHQVYAHRGGEIDSAHFGPLVTDSRPAKIMGFGYLTGRLASFQAQDMRQFRDLIRVVLDHVDKKIATLEKRLEKVCEQLTEEQLSSLPVATFTSKSLSTVVESD